MPTGRFIFKDLKVCVCIAGVTAVSHVHRSVAEKREAMSTLGVLACDHLND